jgi:hypothetical protein
MGNSERKHQAWNFWSAFVFFGLIVLVSYLMRRQGFDIEDMTFKEAVVIVLASYRSTRVLVFEKIFKYFRDVLKKRKDFLVIGTVHSIVTCPWCAGMWMSLIMVVFYYLVPFGDVLCFVMALAGIASLITIISNMMQMNAELKQAVHRREKEKGNTPH